MLKFYKMENWSQLVERNVLRIHLPTWLKLIESPSGLFPPQCTLPLSNRRGRDAFQIWNGHRGWCLVSIGCPITQRPVITLHVQHKPSFQGFPCCRNYHTQRNSFRGKQWLGGLGLGLPPPPPWMWHPHAKRHSDETEFRWMALQLCRRDKHLP